MQNITCLTYSMLHIEVITNDILKCSTRERNRLAFHCHIVIDYTFGHVFTGEVSITLLLHIHFILLFFNIYYIYLLSSTGKRWKIISGHIVRLLLHLAAAWPFEVSPMSMMIQRRADAIVSSTLKTRWR